MPFRAFRAFQAASAHHLWSSSRIQWGMPYTTAGLNAQDKTHTCSYHDYHSLFALVHSQFLFISIIYFLHIHYLDLLFF